MKQRKSLTRVIGGWLLFIMIIVVLIFMAIHFTGEKMTVAGTSMYPTLDEGDELIIDQVSYRFFDPARFDVVVFPSRYQDNTFFIKRIIGLPGETIQIINGQVYINGYELNEKADYEPIEQAGLAANQITLGADQYFVLGDNRNDSADSRDPSFGNVNRAEIKGKAFLRIHPLRSFGLVR